MGTTNLSLSREDFLAFRVPEPSVAQSLASDVLDHLEAKTDLNRRTNDTLVATADALFKSWFVDFDPVSARSERRQPFAVDGKTAALFPASFTNSERGRIPQGWTWTSLLDAAQVMSGGTPKTNIPEYWDGPILWASAKDVSACGSAYLTKTERLITERGLRESATQMIPAHATVIIARGATTGRLVMLGEQMAMNQTCYALHSAATPRYVFLLVKNAVASLRNMAHGSVFDTITTSTLQSFSVVAPSADVLTAFETCVAPMFDRILANARENEMLTTVRDLLLPRLLSGELRVKDAEAAVTAVV
jgi:type I restriction enzyme S subunit